MTQCQNIRILVVDDEKAIRRFLKVSLTSCGYDIFESSTGSEALEKSVSSHPDIIILDLGLPDVSGIEVIRRIRERARTPIIILSVKEQVSDKVAALESGADDYLTKPFNIAELLARLKAVMRRLLPVDEQDVFSVGSLEMNIGKHQVTLAGEYVSLTPTEYEILKLLVLNAGGVLTHSQILRQVWDRTEDVDGASHLLRVTISNLRSKVEPNPDRPTYILTEPGIGYRLASGD